MHLLEQYALSSGLKIGKPFIYEVFYPIASEKYISFHPNSKFASKNYDYWQMVIDLIYPILKKNGIDIVQIGAPGEKGYANCIQTQGLTSINQSAYIIKNSIISFGADSFSAHVASGFGKKIAAIYSNNNINNCRPYWSNKEDVILLEPERVNEKPSYSAEEKPKTINRIKPETISNSVLKLLGIEERINIETLFIGDNFNGEIRFGFLPNKVVVSNNAVPEIRMDLYFDEKNLSSQLAKQKSIITTNRPISKELLLSFKGNVAKIIYIIDEHDNPEFAKFLFENGFIFSCASFLPSEKVSEKKIDYYRYCKIEEIYKSQEEKEFKEKMKALPCQNLRFRTNYIISSENKSYASEQHLLENESSENLNDFLAMKNSEAFLSDLNNFWVVK